MELQRNPPPSTDHNTRVFTIRGSAQQMDVARQLIDDKIGVRKTGNQSESTVVMTSLITDLNHQDIRCDVDVKFSSML